MRQRQVLDRAAEHPDASIEELASMVPSATTELVSRVFDQYGDPAETDDESMDDGETKTASQEATAGGSRSGSSTETSGSTAETHPDESATDAQPAESVGDTGADEAVDETREAEVSDGEAGAEPSADAQAVKSVDEQAAEAAGGGASDADELMASGSETGDTDEEATNDSDGDTSEEAASGSDADDDDNVTTGDDTRDTGDDGATYPAPDDLSAKQRAVLEVIAEYPDATQRELGDKLGVSAATVSNRANSIDGFDWSDRREFVDQVLDSESSSDDPGEVYGEKSEDTNERSAESGGRESQSSAETGDSEGETSTTAAAGHPDESATGDQTDEPIADTEADESETDESETDESETDEVTDDVQEDQSVDEGQTDEGTDANDAGAGDEESGGVDAGDGSAEEKGYPNLGELSEKQKEVLEMIAAQPDATQRELGDKLGVSGATVSNRANSIDGFDWSERREFVEQVLETDAEETLTENPEETHEETSDETPDERFENANETSLEVRNDGGTNTMPAESRTEENDTDLAESIERLEEQISDLEARLEDDVGERASDGQQDSAFDDSELVHKIVHACMNSDRITEEEELLIIETILD